MTLAYAAYKK